MVSEIKIYNMYMDLRSIVQSLSEYLKYEEKMRIHVLQDEEGNYIIQGKDRYWGLTRYIGLDLSMTARINAVDNRILLTMPTSALVRKGTLVLIGLVLLPPLAATALGGMIWQLHFPHRIRRMTK